MAVKSNDVDEDNITTTQIQDKICKIFRKDCSLLHSVDQPSGCIPSAFKATEAPKGTHCYRIDMLYRIIQSHVKPSASPTLPLHTGCNFKTDKIQDARLKPRFVQIILNHTVPRFII